MKAASGGLVIQVFLRDPWQSVVGGSQLRGGRALPEILSHLRAQVQVQGIRGSEPVSHDLSDIAVEASTGILQEATSGSGAGGTGRKPPVLPPRRRQVRTRPLPYQVASGALGLHSGDCPRAVAETHLCVPCA